MSTGADDVVPKLFEFENLFLVALVWYCELNSPHLCHTILNKEHLWDPLTLVEDICVFSIMGLPFELNISF